MKLKTLPVGLLETNCYMLFDEASSRLYVIDPGGDAADIVEAARQFPFAEAVILLTHAHVDHISGLGETAGALHAKTVFLRAPDEVLYRSPANALPPYLPAAGNLPATTPELSLAGLEIIPLPGHTPGGAGFYFSREKILFPGDSLFAGSVGRTDLPGGSWSTLERSLRENLLTLPPDTKVYPGHGPATTIERESKTNPYLN